MEKPARPFPTPLQALSWSYLLAGVIWVGYSLYRIYLASWTTLTKDQWRFYTDYFSIPFPENILTLQNGHPTAFPGLIRLADLYLAGANNQLIITVGVLLTITLACLISWIIGRSETLNKPLKRICIAFCWILIFWLANARVLVHDPILSYSLATLAFMIAIGSLIRADEAYRAGRTGRVTGALLVASLGCFVATFSFGSGILTWLVVLMMTVLLRLPLKQIGLVGVLFVITVVLHSQLPGRGLETVALSINPLHVLPAATTWVGAPIFHILRPTGWTTGSLPLVLSQMVGGIALLAVTAIFLRRLIKRPRLSSLEIWGLAMSALGAGIAFQIAIGRGAMYAGQLGQWIAPRYLPWVCLFWMGFLVLLGLYAHRRTQQPAPKDASPTRTTPHHSRRQWDGVLQGLWLGVVCILPLLMLPGQLFFSLPFENAKYKTQEVALGLVVGVHDDERVQTSLFRRTDVVYQLADELQARGLAMFSWDVSRVMGTPIDQAFEIVEGADVQGHLLTKTAFADGGGLGARIEGWAVEANRRAPRYVVVTNGQGQIQGLALFTRSRQGLTARLNLDPGVRILFSGYIRDYVEDGAYTFYAILSDGRTAAPLPAK